MDGEDRELELHVVWSPFENVAHVVSAQTLAAARAADEAPVIDNFGDLRRHGDLDELADRLASFGEASVEEYVAAIERSADRRPTSPDLAERLAALVDISFDGLDEEEFDPEDGRYLPGDDASCWTEWEIDEAPADEFRGYQLVAKAMSSDIPADVFREFATSRHAGSPAFSGHIDDSVPRDRLDALVAALEARGYTVKRDDS